ncbi:hypothetical protein WIW50_19615 [Flavobacteriaceae bacterium 3-367]|uniref:hypothetical protein n=1 Tax=Eudoraea algarum TaxID=3417568 RepID=UPI0032935955
MEQTTQGKKIENPPMIRPVYWKQVLVTATTVYPMILAMSWLLKQLFPMHLLDPKVALMITVYLVVSVVVFPIMPFLMCYLGAWMQKR